MKKVLLLLLCAALFIVGLTGCANKNKPAANPISDFEYVIDGDNVTIIKYIGTGENVIIPAQIEDKNVTAIGRESFAECTSLTKIIIPDSVEIIDFLAFARNNLTELIIPDSVKIISARAFEYSNLLTKIILSKNITVIDFFTFLDCPLLTSLIIPDGVTEIRGGAFRGCYSLADLTLPDSVIFIADEAFAQCDSITGETREKILRINPKAFDDTL